MTDKAPKAQNPNVSMKMSSEARARMRATEKAIYRYYNDLGKSRGNCTWGAGILAHKGVCTADELKQKVSAEMIDQEFERRVGEAERVVRRNTTVALSQAQFDALCSLTYNSGAKGASETFRFVNQNDFSGAADNISKMIKVGVIEGGEKKYVIAPGLIKRREEESAPFRVKSNAKTQANKERIMSFARYSILRQRIFTLPVLAAVALMAPSASNAADPVEHTVTGNWRFTAALDGADIASLDEREAQQLIGHVFMISKEKVKFDKRDCGPTNFEAEKVEPRLHLRQAFHANAEKLGLPNPVIVVDLSCTSVFIKNPNRLVIAWQGWFFDAVRIKH